MNEPVAWMVQYKNKHDFTFYKPVSHDDAVVIPLYTHPVKELDEQFKKGFETGKEEGWKAHKLHHPVKELTDEEIENIYKDFFGFKPTDKFAVEFARAILRKAQEK